MTARGCTPKAPAALPQLRDSRARAPNRAPRWHPSPALGKEGPNLTELSGQDRLRSLGPHPERQALAFTPRVDTRAPRHAPRTPAGDARLLPQQGSTRAPARVRATRLCSPPECPASPPSRGLGGYPEALRLQFAGTGSHPRPRPHRPWFLARLLAGAGSPRRPLSRAPGGREGAAAGTGRCRLPGGPRLQSGGGGRGRGGGGGGAGGWAGGGGQADASLRRTVREEESDPAGTARQGCSAAPPRRLGAACLACSRRVLGPPLLRAPVLTPWGWGGDWGRRAGRSSPAPLSRLLQVIRSPLLPGPPKAETQRRLLATLGIWARALPEGAPRLQVAPFWILCTP